MEGGMARQESMRSLRADVIACICVAQERPRPRSQMHRMCYSLLMNALTALDADSGVPPARAQRIASHALHEWRAAVRRSLSASSG
jgi:hypothetical protein